MVIAILEYSLGTIHIIKVDELKYKIEDIEDFIFNKLMYDPDSISYMVTDDDEMALSSFTYDNDIIGYLVLDEFYKL